MNEDATPIRIALREEGGFVNAYLAQTSTMQGAKLVGSISVGVARVPGVFEAYKAFWQTTSAALIEQLLPGVKVRGFVDLDVPEHEKAGHA